MMTEDFVRMRAARAAEAAGVADWDECCEFSDMMYRRMRAVNHWFPTRSDFDEVYEFLEVAARAYAAGVPVDDIVAGWVF